MVRLKGKTFYEIFITADFADIKIVLDPFSCYSRARFPNEDENEYLSILRLFEPNSQLVIRLYSRQNIEAGIHKYMNIFRIAR